MSMALKIDIFDSQSAIYTNAKLVMSLLVDKRSITVADLIEMRVESEIERIVKEGINTNLLVGLTAKELALNGQTANWGDTIDKELCKKTATDGFNSNAFFILFNDRQLESLEDDILLSECQTVVFYRLVPLVGG